MTVDTSSAQSAPALCTGGHGDWDVVERATPAGWDPAAGRASTAGP